MRFDVSNNASVSGLNDRPMMQKELHPVSEGLRDYLLQCHLERSIPVTYRDLHHYRYTDALRDEQGKHTHWERVIYHDSDFAKLQHQLSTCWQILTGTSLLEVASVDYCEYANSMPFRINVRLPDQTATCFYIKTADASRVYGMELDRLLSDHSLTYLVAGQTLVETHIQGQPVDEWMIQAQGNHQLEKAAAEAFIRFSTYCLARLLGDMRCYNFVISDTQFRAIDFDQQSYEGRLHMYWPPFYKENLPLLHWVNEHLSEFDIQQIKTSELIRLAERIRSNEQPLRVLLRQMASDELSESYRIVQLRNDLNEYHHTELFSGCSSMGDLLSAHLNCLIPG